MKTPEEIIYEVKKIISDTLGIAEAMIGGESKIVDLSEDSIQLFELLLAFEKFYGVEVKYEDVVRLNTVNDIVQYIERVTHTDAL